MSSNLGRDVHSALPTKRRGASAKSAVHLGGCIDVRRLRSLLQTKSYTFAAVKASLLGGWMVVRPARLVRS